MRIKTQKIHIVVAFIFFVVVGAALLSVSRATNNQPEAPLLQPQNTEEQNQVELPFAQEIGTSVYRTGITLTQWSLDAYGDSDAIARGELLLHNSTDFIAQHVHGFGAIFPRAEDGSYDWTSLDNRFNNVLANADTKVLTACCAPAYMEVPNAQGVTGNFSPYLRPQPEFYDEYAEVIVAAVQRYPDIEYVQVWNEMKGFFDPDAYEGRGGWDFVTYTNLYNAIYDAVKAVKPSVKIGGPYVVITSSTKPDRWFNSTQLNGNWGWVDQRTMDVVTYWLENKNGADFITIDAKNHHDKDDAEQGVLELVDQFEQTDKFIDINNWIRGLDPQTYPDAATLPIWYAEWYSRWEVPADGVAVMDQVNQGTNEQRNAIMTQGLIKTILADTEVAFIWGPQAEATTDPAKAGWMHPLALFSDTRVAGGGQPTAFYQTQQWIHDHFSAGTTLYETGNTNDDIEILASSEKMLMVNETDQQQTTTINQEVFTLSPYEVALFDAPDPVDSAGPEVTETVAPSDPVSEDAVVIGASVSDNTAVDRVEFRRGNTVLETDTVEPFEFNWDTTTVSNGDYDITIAAYDTSGNMTNVTVPVKVRLPDIDRDATVGLQDLIVLISTWGGPSVESDLDDDGTVGLQDLLVIVGNWSNP